MDECRGTADGAMLRSTEKMPTVPARPRKESAPTRHESRPTASLNSRLPRRFQMNPSSR